MDRYSTLSGYKINSSKTEVLPLNLSPQTVSTLSQTFPYSWQSSSLKYLGAHITPTYDPLYKANFPQMFTSIRASLTKWKSLKLSLFGRLATLKMTILPRLLYLFETLPIPIPSSHLKKLQGDLINFFWNYKRHCIARSVLYAPRNQGGLAFPNIAKYYLAAQLRPVASWCTLHAYNRWTQIEKLWLAPIHPNSMLWSSDIPPGSVQLLVPMALARTLWRRAKSTYPLSTTSSPVTSFLFTPNIPDSLTSQMSHFWMDKALFRYGQLIDPKTRLLRSFRELQIAFDIPKQAFFSYLQIRHYAQSLVSNLRFSPLTDFEKLCLEGSSPKGMISRTYQILVTDFSPDGLQHSYRLSGSRPWVQSYP